MNKVSDFLAGIRVLEEVESPINGKITVVKSLAFGTYLQVGGLTQSGGIVTKIWNKTLKGTKSPKLKVQNCLILGLGGGGIVGVVKKYWPDAKITAVDIDPVIVDLGKKYLGLNEREIKIVIEDAESFLKSQVSNLKSKYDLILVDLYNGDQYPEKFETENYIHLVRSLLASDGIIVFNRLYYGDKRPQAVKFLKKLEKNFSEVEVVYPEANVMFVCKK